MLENCGAEPTSYSKKETVSSILYLAKLSFRYECYRKIVLNMQEPRGYYTHEYFLRKLWSFNFSQPRNNGKLGQKGTGVCKEYV